MVLPKVARNLLTIQSQRARKTNEAILGQMKRELRLQEIEKELALATEIQAGQLVDDFSPFNDDTHLPLHARMRPAKAVGGDLYDVMELDQDHIFILLGDVSGKGVPAALFMMRAMGLFRAGVQRYGHRPEKLLSKVNDQLKRNNPNMMFVTVFCSIYNRTTGHLRMANAGHNPPFLLDTQGRAEKITLPYGLIAGAVAGVDFKQGELTLAPGESLHIYTDGITEARNGARELYGDERLQTALAGLQALDAKEIQDRVYAAVDRFTGQAPQADDMTMVSLRHHLY